MFDFYAFYEYYLEDKNKFSAFLTKCEERPIGKKKARQAEADAKLVKAIISEVVVKKEKNVLDGSDSVMSAYATSGESGGADASRTGGAMGDVLKNISNVIASVRTALLENMRFVQSLDTPDCKMYAREQLAL